MQDDKRAFELNANPELPNIWIDNMSFALREDEVCILRFSTTLPEGVFEQSRVFTKRDTVEKMIDVLCNSLDYFPTKTKKPSKTKKRVKRAIRVK